LTERRLISTEGFPPLPPPKFEYHCGRIKAAPDKCPVCGQTYVRPKNWSMGELLRSYFESPCHIERRDVEGWRGFHTWWFVCHHEPPIVAQIYEKNSFISTLSKDDAWQGGSFMLPLNYGKKLTGIIG